MLCFLLAPPKPKQNQTTTTTTRKLNKETKPALFFPKASPHQCTYYCSWRLYPNFKLSRILYENFRRVNYFWTVTLILSGHALFQSCWLKHFLSCKHETYSCSTEPPLCLPFRSVCVRSVCVLNRNHQCSPFYTRHSLSVTSEQEEMHRWVKYPSLLAAKPIPKRERGEGVWRKCREGKYSLTSNLNESCIYMYTYIHVHR